VLTRQQQCLSVCYNLATCHCWCCGGVRLYGALNCIIECIKVNFWQGHKEKVIAVRLAGGNESWCGINDERVPSLLGGAGRDAMAVFCSLKYRGLRG